jgi:hypothetical protein
VPKNFNIPKKGQMGGMMQQMQRLQEQLIQTQEQLAQETLTYSAGGGRSSLWSPAINACNRCRLTLNCSRMRTWRCCKI